MSMYADHLQIRLDFGHGMLIFLILAQFWPSETGQIWGFRDFFWTHGWNGLKFNMLGFILTTFGTDYIRVMVYWVCWFWRHFDWVKQVNCAVSRHFRDNAREECAEVCRVRLVIYLEMKMANFSTWRLSGYRAGGIPDYCVVRLF